MKEHTRRSFVKTSAATGLTFTFAGLIRAHGAPAGGNTTWNPEETFFSTNSGETTTYVTTDPGVTTTWDPDQTVTTAEETTEPPETPTTGVRKYTLESRPKGTPPSETNPSWDSYNELWDTDNLTTIYGNQYACKIKTWVTPAPGKGQTITIEYAAELFPNGVPSGSAAATLTTGRLNFDGILPDELTPAMSATLTPPASIPIISLTGQEPGLITGLLSAACPAGLPTDVYDIVVKDAPSGADGFIIGSLLALQMTSIKEFSALPASAAVLLKIDIQAQYLVVWTKDSTTNLSSKQYAYAGREVDTSLFIEVAGK